MSLTTPICFSARDPLADGSSHLCSFLSGIPFLQCAGVRHASCSRYSNVQKVNSNNFYTDLNVQARRYGGNGDAMFVSFPPVMRKWNLFSGQVQGPAGHLLGIAKSYSDTLVTRAFCSGDLHALWAQPEIPIKIPSCTKLCVAILDLNRYEPCRTTRPKTETDFCPHLRSVK